MRLSGAINDGFKMDILTVAFKEQPYKDNPANSARLEQFTYVADSVVIPPTEKARVMKPKGLFARQFIEAGQLIGAYTGEITTRRRFLLGECEDHTYILWLEESDPADPRIGNGDKSIANAIGIDGKFGGNLRYANHSRDNFNMTHKGAFFYAARDIQPGEEMTWRYGNYDFNNESANTAKENKSKSIVREILGWAGNILR